MFCVLNFRVAGTVGAIVTCPLEVVKTRLQSSQSGFAARTPPPPKVHVTYRTLTEQRRRLWTSCQSFRPQVVALSGYGGPTPPPATSLVQCLKHIIKHEGPMALFKGKINTSIRLCST